MVTMSDLRYLAEPELNDPTLVMGFFGWPNAGDVSSDTISYLIRTLKASPLAYIKPESYYDYTSLRPTAIIREGIVEKVESPSNDFFYFKGESAGPEEVRDLIFLLGHEPHRKWEAFSSEVMTLAQKFGVKRIYTIGATFDYLPHWMNPRMSVVCSSEEVKSEFKGQIEGDDLIPVDYQGSVSIHTPFLQRAQKVNMPVIALWGHAPVYINTGNFKVQLRLVETLAKAIGFSFDTTDLIKGIGQMEAKVREQMDDNPQLREFIQDLERVYHRENLIPPRPSMMGASPGKGKVISIDEFLNREKADGS